MEDVSQPTMRNRIVAVLFAALLVNTAYIAAFAEPTVFYMGNVLAHLIGGLIFTGIAIWVFPRWTSIALIVSALIGLYIAKVGNTFGQRRVLWAHIIVGGIFVVMALARYSRRMVALASLLIIVPMGAALYRRAFPNPHDRIRNPELVPAVMEEEGGGKKSPFFPSSAVTNVGGTIPSNFFMDSELCGVCHKDIYEQWKSSMHHFASFNNQFYRKSIEYMQSVNGTSGSKWCAGCHDHAVFFNGRFEKPIKDQIDTPEAQNGLGCVSCHSIPRVTARWVTADSPSNIRRCTNWHRAGTNTSAQWITFSPI